MLRICIPLEICAFLTVTISCSGLAFSLFLGASRLIDSLFSFGISLCVCVCVCVHFLSWRGWGGVGWGEDGDVNVSNTTLVLFDTACIIFTLHIHDD